MALSLEKIHRILEEGRNTEPEEWTDSKYRTVKESE